MKQRFCPTRVSLYQRQNWAIECILCFVGVLLINLFGRADRQDYNRVKNILVEGKYLSVLHHHDWSFDREKRIQIMNSWLGPFQPGNIYAYVECIDQKSGQVLFRLPSPPLTFIWISDDSKYIVGLSNIRLDNPVQLIVINRDGHIIKKRKIGSRESELTQNEYAQFIRQFPSAAGSLMSRDRIVAFNNKIYIDPQDIGPAGTAALVDAWDYLNKRATPSHFSQYFSQSTMNWIHWFKEDGPEIRLIYEAGNLVGISLLDPKGQRFEIPIIEQFLRW